MGHFSVEITGYPGSLLSSNQQHGLADVDEPYFSEIMDRVDLTATRWTVSTFQDLAERLACFGAYGIPPHLVRYLEMTDFD